MRSACFWNITQRRMVILYQRFGTTYGCHLQGSRSPRWCELQVQREGKHLPLQHCSLRSISREFRHKTSTIPWRHSKKITTNFRIKYFNIVHWVWLSKPRGTTNKSRCLPSPKQTHQLWGPATLIFSGCCGLILQVQTMNLTNGLHPGQNLKMDRARSPLPPYAFMVWCLITHGTNVPAPVCVTATSLRVFAHRLYYCSWQIYGWQSGQSPDLDACYWLISVGIFKDNLTWEIWEYFWPN
jgi:hypothetical protein